MYAVSNANKALLTKPLISRLKNKTKNWRNILYNLISSSKCKNSRGTILYNDKVIIEEECQRRKKKKKEKDKSQTKNKTKHKQQTKSNINAARCERQKPPRVISRFSHAAHAAATARTAPSHRQKVALWGTSWWAPPQGTWTLSVGKVKFLTAHGICDKLKKVRAIYKKERTFFNLFKKWVACMHTQSAKMSCSCFCQPKVRVQILVRVSVRVKVASVRARMCKYTYK